ncbi:MAG TPA: hypothetical protein VHD57_18990 [Vicinamibacterales bacterium]|nr:hypothetical protein [Vicinamibacterales bacterium]
MTLARDAEDNRNRRWPLVWGGTLVVVGVLSFGDRVGWWPGLNWVHLWPIVMIVTGTLLLLPPWERAPGAGVGWWLVTEGVLFLLNAYGILSLKTSWPLLIVAAGVWIVVAGGRSRRDRRHAR